MDDTRRDLQAYYEAEAQLRVREPLSTLRRTLVDEYVELLRAEGRTSVVDFGSGPGRDGLYFAAAGHRYVGIDLAIGNAHLAAERGVTVLPADLTELPFRRQTFEAGWSMSTLMHLPDAEVLTAVRELSSVLQPGAPLAVGLWGGTHGDVISEQGIEGHRRLFSLRSPERNAELLSVAGQIEWSTSREFGPDAWTYQLFRLRAGT